MGRPARSASAARERSSIEATAEPTVPNPARPTLSGSAMGNPETLPVSAALGERHNVVQLFRTSFKKAANVAGGLANALLVLDQRDANEAFAALAEAGPRRHRHFGLLDQKLRELDAAERLERLGDRRPGEHGRARGRHVPAGAPEAFHQHVTAAL